MKKIILLNIFYFSFCTVAVKSAEKGGMPQLDPEFWVSQIFWLTITFGTLFLVLSKFILPRISKNLEQRRLQILENIETAEKQREQSEKNLKEFDEIILKSKNKALFLLFKIISSNSLRFFSLCSLCFSAVSIFSKICNLLCSRFLLILGKINLERTKKRVPKVMVNQKICDTQNSGSN